MALARYLSVFTYQSSSGGETYTFDIVVDAQDLVSVRNIRSPYGLITDSLTKVPSDVAQDILDAMSIVELQVAESTVTSGTTDFTGQVSNAVVLAGGLLNNSDYRVQVTTPDGIIMRVESKTITGFTLVSPALYGDAADVKTVSWVVLTSTLQSSAFGATLTFAAGETSKSVVFPAATASSNYRVLLEESDFFFAKVANQTTLGFDIIISFDPDPGSVTVGYDVII